VLAVVAAALVPHAAATAAAVTAGPFATLAAIILASALAGRLGAFALLARAFIPARSTPVVAAAATLIFTALLSALVNLDVAVVVATPVALGAAQRHRLSAGRLAVAVAMTANAASFLLPTSNITNLLLASHLRLSAAAFVSDSWLPWILVTAITVAPLAWWAAGARTTSVPAAEPGGPSARTVSDLIPMYLLAAAIRALLGGLTLAGGFTGQLAAGALLAATVNNLPAAAAIVPHGAVGLWAAILATTIGPGLLVTGSVATLIARRIAGDSNVRFSAWHFSAIGLMLVPAQLAIATLGLHITGAL
jgi:Na+/H+ antiporter NhaD/arsenite permease-like protein